MTGGRNHGSFGQKDVNYPERTVAPRPDPAEMAALIRLQSNAALARSEPWDRSRAGGPGSQGFQSGGLAGAGEPVAAVAPVTAGRQQAQGPAQVARFVNGPADVVFVRWLTGPGCPEPLFGNRLPHGRRDLAVGHRVGTQEQAQEQLPGVYEEAVLISRSRPWESDMRRE